MYPPKKPPNMGVNLESVSGRSGALSIFQAAWKNAFTCLSEILTAYISLESECPGESDQWQELPEMNELFVSRVKQAFLQNGMLHLPLQHSVS